MKADAVLDARQVATLRAQLDARAEALRGEIRAALHPRNNGDTMALPNRREESDDEALAEAATGLDVASVVRDVGELNDVVEALARVDSPSFGACVDCGEPIAWARLLAQPQAKRCVACEANVERRRAGPGPATRL